jgi:2-phosphosulfolactate phosphatase
VTAILRNLAGQLAYHVRFEWGWTGLQAIAADDPVVIVVDVLSFSTAVSIALSRGAAVLPFPWRDERGAEYARHHGALLAGDRGTGAYSLSPTSLGGLPARARIVLPSPNGSTLCFGASSSTVTTGCLRNRRAVVELAQSFQRPIAVVAAGERWPDGSLRPALEDLLGAGAIISRLPGTRSAEAQAAALTFESTTDLSDALLKCASGVELSERGFLADLAVAGELDVDDHASVLRDAAFAATMDVAELGGSPEPSHLHSDTSVSRR